MTIESRRLPASGECRLCWVDSLAQCHVRNRLAGEEENSASLILQHHRTHPSCCASKSEILELTGWNLIRAQFRGGSLLSRYMRAKSPADLCYVQSLSDSHVWNQLTLGWSSGRAEDTDEGTQHHEHINNRKQPKKELIYSSGTSSSRNRFLSMAEAAFATLGSSFFSSPSSSSSSPSSPSSSPSSSSPSSSSSPDSA